MLIKQGLAFRVYGNMENKPRIPLNLRDIDRIVEMAWEDRTPFEAITFQFNVSEKEIIEIMRREMNPSSFRIWRKRVKGRSFKSRLKRNFSTCRYRSSRQRSISNNKISIRR